MPDKFHENAGEIGEFRAGLTDDAFLGGKLKILQPEKGYRAGIDAVMLAASIPAREGDTIFEAGIGTGVAALCLAARVDDVKVVGIEDATLHVLIAEENAKRNELSGRVKILKGNLLDSMRHDQVDWPAPGSFDHAFANPPYFEDHTVQPPKDSLRAQAHLLKPGQLEAWVKVMTGLVKPRGSVTLIHPASSLHAVLAAMEPRLGALSVLPLRAQADADASRIIVRGIKGSKGPIRLLPGIVLHQPEQQGYAPNVERILRHGEALEL